MNPRLVNLRLPLLLLLACCFLTGLAFAYLMIVRANERRARIDSRLSTTLRRHGAAVEDVTAPMRVSVPVVQRSIGARLAGLLGVDLSRRDLYPSPWWGMAVIAVVPARGVTFLLEYMLGPLAVLATPAVYWLICNKYFKSRRQKRITILFEQFPDALAMIVRAVRVGIPITEAIRAVGAEVLEPTAGEFVRLANDVSIGTPLDQALRAMAERNQVAEYRFFATALSLQHQTGGAISETLENLADVIRKRVAARARGRALAAEARASATALAVLPVLALVGFWLLRPDYIDVLFLTDSGRRVLALAVLLEGIGIFSMRTIIQKSLS